MRSFFSLVELGILEAGILPASNDCFNPSALGVVLDRGACNRIPNIC